MKIKHLLFAGATSLLASNAHAADLEVEPVAIQTYDWQGVYGGGQFGFGWFEGRDNLGSPPENLASPVGGVHVGYNHMLGQFVLGIEGEANLANFSDTTSANLDVDINWMIAARLRAGYAFDRFLAFATTGVSFSEVTFEIPGTGISDSNTHTGFLFGGGVEGYVTEHISVRAEYQHHWFGNESYNVGAGAFDIEGDLDLLRAGVSYHF
ncbi:outer membrane protein, putative [Stappia aggregata IAM 12614]|uniref:Outer membrane protein, putative n=1 Tax=Roseibium aggregatum (strain ATCC 25650 / DSM 13394 / JCM 20685 / NBRC 16684 / NCIMB 2208 / IAM 12614 / B1) TaxID=384765 RepID=A0P2Q2_ROSAI|nr:outer membrane beta-barrel protein [Roseibium aggregatum]EAV40705.1 outer membrane protein, putative [Stappia aggregata IAM 12614] [Roseibium aggregatum IAM 12614]